jgi:DNA-binding IclR family transcriptional regulator
MRADDGIGRKPAGNAIASLKNGLAVLRCFTAEQPLLKIGELSARTGLPRQTVQRLAYTLARLGCLENDAQEGRYRLGQRLLPAGRTMLSQLSLREQCRPIMQRLADETGTSVALGAGHELQMLYLEYCVSRRAVTFVLRSGSGIPMAQTALGRAYLWALAARRRSPLLAAIRREAGGQGAELLAAIQDSFRELDKDGFCCTFPSARSDICGVGAPLVFNGGDTILAINCGAARLGLNERRFRRECGPPLLRAIADIKNAIGTVSAEQLGIAESLSRG